MQHQHRTGVTGKLGLRIQSGGHLGSEFSGSPIHFFRAHSEQDPLQRIGNPTFNDQPCDLWETIHKLDGIKRTQRTTKGNKLLVRDRQSFHDRRDVIEDARQTRLTA
jgi:hypothetical protein